MTIIKTFVLPRVGSTRVNLRKSFISISTDGSPPPTCSGFHCRGVSLVD